VCPRTRRQRCRRVPCAVGCSRRHGNACACQYPASTRPGTARAETACLALDHATAEHFEPLAL
jgi:hypothetical protein